MRRRNMPVGKKISFSFSVFMELSPGGLPEIYALVSASKLGGSPNNQIITTPIIFKTRPMLLILKTDKANFKINKL